MTARRHHYVPQCYLKGFVRHRDKPKLFVVDGQARRSFTTDPANVAAERDFHTVEIDGKPSDAVENAFASFESAASLALDRVIARETFEDEHDRSHVLNLMALIAVKNPLHRATFRRFQERVYKGVMRVATETPERWNAQVERGKQEGFFKDDAASQYERVKAFVDADEYDIVTGRETHLALELDQLDAVLPYFFRRRWTMLRAKPGTTGFITSDHPTCLQSSIPRDSPFRPGFGTMDTEVIFPVSNRLALVGIFDGEEGLADADEHLVAHVNSVVIHRAQRQIFAMDGNFRYLGRREHLRRGVDLPADDIFYREKQRRPDRRS